MWKYLVLRICQLNLDGNVRKFCVDFLTVLALWLLLLLLLWHFSIITYCTCCLLRKVYAACCGYTARSMLLSACCGPVLVSFNILPLAPSLLDHPQLISISLVFFCVCVLCCVMHECCCDHIIYLGYIAPSYMRMCALYHNSFFLSEKLFSYIPI